MASATAPPAITNLFNTVPNRLRSYGCYNCNNSFFITPVSESDATPSSPLPTSFRCPHCFYLHLIPFYAVIPPPPPTPVAHFAFNYYQNDDEDQEQEEDEYSEEDFEDDDENDDEDEDHEDEDGDEDDNGDAEDEEEEIIGYYEDFALNFPDYDDNSHNIVFDLDVVNLYLNSLPGKELEKNKKSNCSVCMEEIGSKGCVVELPCKHCFHEDCIREWLLRKNTCPMCRFKLDFDNLDHGTEVVERGEVEPVLSRVNAETSSLSDVGDAEATGSDSRVLITNSGERSRWFEGMRDEDGDTLMEDAA